jgi:virC1 protein
MTKIIAIANQKGGVGKTATTMNLGTALTLQGKRVLLIDSDPQANLTNYLGNDSKVDLNSLTEGLDAIIEKKTFDFKNLIKTKELRTSTETTTIDYIVSNKYLSGVELALSQVIGGEMVFSRLLRQLPVREYDFVLIDTKPSLGRLLINVLIASDSVIIPVDSKNSSLEGYQELKTTINEIADNLGQDITIEGLLQTMVTHTNNSKAVTEILKTFNVPVFQTTIPLLNEAESSYRMKQSVFSIKNGKLAGCYEKLAEELIEGRNDHE